MTETPYIEFLQSKELKAQPIGKETTADQVHEKLFDFQRDAVVWAVRKGRAALFLDTGLGKTFCQLEWARLIDEPTLIIAPLTVARQTVNEAEKIRLEVRYVRSQDQVVEDHKLYITNYEMIDHFDAKKFNAVVLDESSILKNLTGATKQKLVAMFADTPYKLCATATPAPNDITEIANHSEFLNVLPRAELLATFFAYDAGGTGKADSWRLKKHSMEAFYRWLASWALAIRKPSDLGYDDTKFQLPPMTTTVTAIDADYQPEGMLPGFFGGNISATDQKAVRRETVEDRAQLVAKMVNDSDEQWILWGDLNAETDRLHELIPGSINVHGSLSPDEKADGIDKFVSGEIRVLITKMSIAGFGINMQQCHNMAFCGVDYSWESYYQAVHRIYRFGQEKPVNIHVITTNQEMGGYRAIESKGERAETMMQSLIDASKQYMQEELKKSGSESQFDYQVDEKTGPNWRLLLGDSTERMSEIPDESIDISVYSPPFTDIFVYSATPRDLGNSKNLDQFFAHYDYIIRENYRITKSGRLACVHVADARSFKTIDGFIGRKDFSGQVIEAYTKAGWIFWQRITIDKNPQAQAIRLKDHGLLFKTLKKDSTGLAGGHADYLLIFKKPGDNKVPVTPYDNGEVSSEDWISWAHPVWYDIRESDVLNVRVARSDEDEKHMCPLQLPLIERCVKLWSNPHETVFSPFAGIGSEGYEALRHNRKFLGIELKPEYFQVACRNLENAEQLATQKDMFAYMQAVENKETETISAD